MARSRLPRPSDRSPAFLEPAERVPAVVRGAQAAALQDVRREVDRGLAGPLHVQHDGLLQQEVALERREVPWIDFADPPHAVADVARLAGNDVTHRRGPRAPDSRNANACSSFNAT